MINTEIVINSVRLHHSGVYYCLGVYDDGETYFLAKTLLQVIGKLCHIIIDIDVYMNIKDAIYSQEIKVVLK